MATVLVTGGAGYIGSFTRRALEAAGHRSVTLDNLSTGHREFVDGDIVIGDTRDGAQLRRILAERRIDAVIHFAASALARQSVAQPDIFYDNNVNGCLALLEACRQARVMAFVFSSSCAIYGNPRYVPIDEDHPEDPISPYGRTKLVCEWLLRDWARAFGLRYAALRYFNAAGGAPDGSLGEWHDPESHLIPLAMTAAVSGRPLSIFGADLDTPDGTCVRDYIHVQDLARAHVLALDRLLAGGPPLALNLGTGIGHSIREVLASVERVTGRRVPAETAPAHPGDPPRLVANADRARDVLGFACQWTDLDAIVASAWAFHRKIVGA